MPGGTSPVQRRNAQKIDLDATDFWRRKDGRVWRYLSAPLTSVAWAGNARSTTAKTLIDLSAVFSVPAGVKAVLVYLAARDSGSAANDCFVLLSPNNTGASGPAWLDCFGLTNDAFEREQFVVPCDANGDIYFQCQASGVDTLDVWLEIWGYCP